MNGRILDLDAADYGDYKCVSANSLGTDQQTMTLFGKSLPRVTDVLAVQHLCSWYLMDGRGTD